MSLTKQQMYGAEYEKAKANARKRGVLGTVLSNIKSNVTLPVDIVKYRSQAFLSNRKTDAIKKKFKNDVKEYLAPESVVGADNYNKAARTIDKHVDSGKYRDAAQYASDQLNTIADQSAGNTKVSKSQREYINNLLVKLRQRFPSVK